MKHLRTWWLLIAGLVLLPYGFIFLAGAAWLYERHALWYWIGATAVVTLAAVGIAEWLRAKSLEPIRARVRPNPNWSPRGEAAWSDVQLIVQRAKSEPLNWQSAEAVTTHLWSLLREVLDTVARHYHPRAREPALNVTVPDVLAIVELAARDLREQISRSVPLSHVLTLNDLRRLPQLGVLMRKLYAVYRVVRFGLNPWASIPRELVDAVSGRYQEATIEEAGRWALGYFLEKAGYYAIQLYSGHLVIDEGRLDGFRSPDSVNQVVEAAKTAEAQTSEPLRFLVCGQVKAGKSSLINALFGDVIATTDVVPRTRDVQAFSFDIAGVRKALILDTAGYDELSRRDAAGDQLRREIRHADIVLLVVSAVSAARAADRQMLDAVRALCRREPDRAMPPVLVVLSHIDLLRPINEWRPPYDLKHASSSKSLHIRQAIDAVASDLEVDPGSVVPVCLMPDRLYNVEEGLIPAIVHALPAAKRARCLRMLPQFRRAQQWELLWQQAVESGRLLWKWTTGRPSVPSDERRGPHDGTVSEASVDHRTA